MPKFTYLVLSNPVPGREQEYNDWYTHQHIPDVLEVPGVLNAQRFKLSAQQRRPGALPWAYLALYQCDAPEPDVVTQELVRRAGTAQMVPSDAIAKDTLGCYFEAITEVLVPGASRNVTRA